MKKTYKGDIKKLQSNQIFVFGSNTDGKHGKGAAWTARKLFGAVYGQPKGPQGQSYAIVTKNINSFFHPSITQREIMHQIKQLYAYARTRSTHEFFVAYKGSGYNLNGYSPEQMAKMFAVETPPDNIVFEYRFKKLILIALENQNS